MRKPQTIVVSGSDIQKSHAVDLKQALKNISGVQVAGVPNAPQGNDNITIRGIRDNRIAIDVDGISMPDGLELKLWALEGIVFGRGQFMDNSALGSVAIDYSSKGQGLGGSVSMKTLSIDDVLDNKQQSGYVEAVYNNIDRSMMYSAVGAMESGSWKGMILGTYRNGHEIKTAGNIDIDGNDLEGLISRKRYRINKQGRKDLIYRTKANPLNYSSRYLLTKHQFGITPSQKLAVVAEYLDRNSFINQKDRLDLYRNAVTSAESKNDVSRYRLSLMHYYENADNPYLQELKNHVYWQKAQTQSEFHSTGNDYGTTEYNRDLYLKPGFRDQSAVNTDQVFGLNTDAYSHFDYQKLGIDWHYGGQLAYHSITTDWQSNYLYLQAGYTSGQKPTMVTKPFADAKQLALSLFSDADWRLNNVVLNTGLSFHYYWLSPSDKDYRIAEDEAIDGLKTLKAIKWTPRIGLNWEMHPAFIPYFEYSRGFKAPNSQQITNAFDPGPYAVFGNPNLKPETANNFGLGIRGQSNQLEYGVHFFRNYYQNFITTEVIPNSIRGVGTLHYVNLERALIQGYDAYIKWNFAQNWHIKGTIEQISGKKFGNFPNGYQGNQQIFVHSRPLRDTPPLKAAVSLRYDTNKWGFNVDVSHSNQKRNEDLGILAGSSVYNPHIAYTLVDIGAYWQPTQNLTITGGINNLFNKKYWDWANIAYLIPEDDIKADLALKIREGKEDFYSSPGRNFNLGLRYQF